MDILSIILIAIGLAMDCFAVSVSKGLATSCVVRPGEQHCARFSPKAVLMAVLFGVFQGGMPLIGYFAGTLFADFFSKFSPWIALGLLVFIGGKMIYDVFHGDEDGCCNEKTDKLDMKEVLTLAVATSIDALAVGISFAFLQVEILKAMSVIGVITFVLSAVGVAVGNMFGAKYEKNATLAGGIILILIGLKILLEHTGIIG